MITIQAESEEQMLRMCAEWLESRGAKVVRPGRPARWMTPKEMTKEFGISPAGLHKRLASVVCPKFEFDGTKNKRQRILVHEKLEVFLHAQKAPGSQLTRVSSI